ncbi:unnamed protein product [Closterium sp. Naga37s-1]|nr:unnamed protein product [Closterium sp. Naga37s-1]
MAISRTLALACALPLLALLVTSHFVNVSADISLVGFSSSDVVSYAGDLTDSGASVSSLASSTRRVLDDDDDEDKAKKEAKKKKKEEEKAKKEAEKAAKKAKSSKSPPASPEPTPSPPPPPSPSPDTTTTKSPKTPKSPKSPKTPKTPVGASPPASPAPKSGKSPKTPQVPPVGAKVPPKKVSAADTAVKADLAAAAKLVDEANAVLTVKTYKKSLTYTAQALRNAGILIDQGQRTLVPGQITNAISTIKGVSVMLKPATDKATLGLLKSAQTKAESAQAAFKP